jgi:hypothetical protein
MASIIIPSSSALPPVKQPEPIPLSPGEWALAQLDRIMSGQSNRGGQRSDQPQIR